MGEFLLSARMTGKVYEEWGQHLKEGRHFLSGCLSTGKEPAESSPHVGHGLVNPAQLGFSRLSAKS